MELVGTCFVILTIVAMTWTINGFPYMEAQGGDPGQQWGYVRTRQEASVFWWLHHSTHPEGYLQRPLIIWLQGGPGVSGSGIGNFAMFGPLDHNLEPRNTTWVREVNMMYIDSPVSTGFSYLHGNATPPTSCHENSMDLINMLQVFLTHNPEFVTVPIYIFGQSYGGKMAANFGYYLEMARQDGEITCNLQGVAIGNGWVSPLHITASWPDFLLFMSLIDEEEYRHMEEALALLLQATAHSSGQDHEHLSQIWESITEDVHMNHVDFYNVLNPGTPTIYELELWPLMDGPVKEQLGIIPQSVNWTGFSAEAYQALYDSDFLKSEVPLVDALLQNSEVDIIVYSGQLDLICSTKGAIDWVNTLQWPGLTGYHERERVALLDPDTDREEMFVKAYGHLKFYWVLNSGHVVPVDVPETALRMLDRIINDVDH